MVAEQPPSPPPPPPPPAAPVVITPGLLQRFDVAGPRYTSYPTADRFVPTFGAADYIRALGRRRSGGAGARALSLYVHIPFCRSLCHYCACNKIVTRRQERAALYLDYLLRELALHMAQIGPGQRISQLHLGGGTPTFFSDAQLRRLMEALRTQLHFADGGEYAIEVDPRTVDASRLAALKDMGFNRLSFGVQDFDARVQQAVHRVQDAGMVCALFDSARALGFDCINADLIYGLPHQDVASFARTLAQVVQLRPARIALYSYAHLPQRFKAQRRIAIQDLPDASCKLRILADAITTLTQAGYVYIGMDHFALPHDGLALARRQGRLHRNFQGYSTQPECDLIALGVSAIGRVGSCYAQNAKTLEPYYAAIDRGQLPVVRGLELTRDDLVRRAVIMAIMCQGVVFFEAVEQAWLLDFRRYFARELQALEALQDQGLVRLGEDAFEVTALGWFFVRAVAMRFDRHLERGVQEPVQFSRIV